jgi:hypothetical protein
MPRADLVSDCGNCAALCCVATSFEASDDFACDKAAGVACVHLQAHARCAIHAQRIERGFAGCTVYECYGAGPRITRAFPGAAPIDTFVQLRAVHELLWLVTEAAKVCPARERTLRAELDRAGHAVDCIASGPLERLCDLDLHALQLETHVLLRRVGRALGGRKALAVIA